MVSMAIASLWASMAAWFTPTVLFCATNLIIATIFIASNNTNRQHQHQHHVQADHHDHSPPPISRVSSFLDRARSFKFSSFSTTTVEPPQYDQYNASEPKTATYSSSSRLAQSIHSFPADYVPPTDLSYPISEPETETQPLSQRASDSPGQLARPPSFLERVKSFRLSYGQTERNVGSDSSHDPDHEHVVRSKSERKSVKKSVVEMKKSRSEMRMAITDNEEEEEEEDVNLRRPATSRERRSHVDVDSEGDARADDFISRFKQKLKLQRMESLVRFNQMLNRGT